MSFALLPFCAWTGGAAASPAEGDRLPAWTPGQLDIHHISTGSGDSAFFILPDGTTMLLDAGDVDRVAMAKFAPLRVQDPKPDASRRAGEWIADYVRQFAPAGTPPRIDYALVSHFHSDHFGKVSEASPRSKSGPYRLTGIMDVAELVPVGTLIDRAAPDYMVPTNMRACPGNQKGTVANYLAFVDHRIATGRAVEGLVPGRKDQIRLLREPGAYPEFAVRNVAASGTLWTGRGDATFAHIPLDEAGGCAANENPLSLAIKLTYGAFDYYSGGDLTGMAEFDQPLWFNIESALGAAVGPVDVMTLNHHGNRDATNSDFLRALRPRVLVQQSWISDHPGGEVLHRMISPGSFPGPRDIFSTGMLPETRVTIGPWMERAYKSFEGHVVIRVASGGGTYEVFILNDRSPTRAIKGRFGPYVSN